MLEIEKLLEAEKLASSDVKFDATYEQRQKTLIADGKSDEAEDITENESDQETDPATNTVEGTYSDSVEQGKEEDLSEGLESIRSMRFDTLAIPGAESFGDRIPALVSRLGDGVKYMASLGMTYTPLVANKLFVQVAYIVSRIAKTLVTGTVQFAKYVERRIYSFENLKGNIDSLLETLDEVKEPDTQLGAYNKEKVINALKIGDSVDFKANFVVLENFVKQITANLDRNIHREFKATAHLLADASVFTKNNPPLNHMKLEPMMGFMERKRIHGFDAPNATVEVLAYKEDLPGDTAFMAVLPVQEFQDKESITTAYDSSSMMLGFDQSNFQPVESVNYMTIDELKAFLNQLSALCTVAIEHQELFKKVLSARQGLKLSLRHYFMALVNSRDKVSLKDSLAEYIYLKTMFCDKVYLVAMMDVHDYLVKCISNAISFARQNAKQF